MQWFAGDSSEQDLVTQNELDERNELNTVALVKRRRRRTTRRLVFRVGGL